MGIDAREPDSRRSHHLLDQPGGLFLKNAHATHPRVDLNLDLDRRLRLGVSGAARQ